MAWLEILFCPCVLQCHIEDNIALSLHLYGRGASENNLVIQILNSAIPSYMPFGSVIPVGCHHTLLGRILRYVSYNHSQSLLCPLRQYAIGKCVLQLFPIFKVYYYYYVVILYYLLEFTQV